MKRGPWTEISKGSLEGHLVIKLGVDIIYIRHSTRRFVRQRPRTFKRFIPACAPTRPYPPYPTDVDLERS